MAFLTRILGRRRFPLSQFDLEPLAFELQAVEDDELLLDCPFIGARGPNVIALPGAPRTPGQLRESIERHLRLSRNDDPPLLEQDAVDELREAIAELRRSLA